jgi:hypothetical protein
MRIAYFPNYVAQNGSTVLSAFLDSCSRLGITTVQESMDADVAVIWSVLWSGRMAKNQAIYQHYRQQNKPVIVIDIGALRRGFTWKIAVNNITADGYYGHQENLDWNRPSKLGISLGHAVSSNHSVLIAAQHFRSLQVEKLTSMELWITQQINTIRKYTDRPVVVRPHPRSQLNTKLLPKDISIETPQHVSGTYDNFNLEFGYRAMINYNSGVGTQAGIKGCSIIVDSSSLAYPVSTSYEYLEQLPVVNRDQWLVEICHTEYTLEEIKQGLWIQRLHSQLAL